MSSMFSNFFNKGFKKFSNILFCKNGVSSLDISKESAILNNITNNANKSNCNSDSLDAYAPSKCPSNLAGKDKIIPVFWEDKEKSDKEIKDINEITARGNRNKYLESVLSNFPNNFSKNIQSEESKNQEDELIPNRLKNRVCEAHISANHPREDRSNAIQLKNFDGYFLSVLDGHGGEDVAEYANKELHKKFDMKYMELKGDLSMKEQDKVKTAIEYAFEQIEREYYNKAKINYEQGDAKFAYIGSCVLCVVVHDNLLYVANLGDCKARLFRKKQEEGVTYYDPQKITVTHNAGKSYEKIRLRKKFKDEDIIVDKGYASYVKGRLQPTKSLGDLYMKHKEFNDPPVNIQEKYARKVIDDFNGPYIDHVPDVQVFELTAADEFLVLATDGLWDWLNSKDVADIISQNCRDKSKIANALWKEALNKAAERANLNFDQILELPRQIKRSIHDDISLLVVDLKNQVSACKSKRIN